MPKDDSNDQLSRRQAHDAAAAWLADFDTALTCGDAKAAGALFLADGHWRDLLAFTWDIRTMNGAGDITAMLAAKLETMRPCEFQLAPGRTPPRWVMRAGSDAIEAIFSFKTALGTGSGVLRLQPDPAANGQMRAWILLTTLDELAGHGPRLSTSREGGDAFKREFGGDNWLDYRNKARAYADRDPAVLVVGGGQAGLGVTACLSQLGVDTLIVDRHARIGDNWRKRYHSLTLHNEVFVNHMPYMPFPPTWPVFIPKDMLANWFEMYVEALELNYWPGTSLTTGRYDSKNGTWEVTLERADGTTRIMRPRHVIFATGVSAIPVMADMPGLKDFSGTVMHSGAYTTGHEWAGGKAIIIGTGNSAHDVAQDLHACGVGVTMIQRSSTHIVSLTEAQRVYDIYKEGISIDDCDLLATSFPFPVLRTAYKRTTVHTSNADKDLLQGLAARGFRLNSGVDDCGFQMSYLQRGGGYYFNVGCSDLIVDGEIDIVQFDDVDRFTADGLMLKDGRTLPADLVVMATGYKNQQETARAYLGDDVADRVGPVWGFSDGGELRNMWCRTPQPGLWFTAGSLAQCRIFSPYLAMQIKACEAGLLSPERDGG